MKTGNLNLIEQITVAFWMSPSLILKADHCQFLLRYSEFFYAGSPLPP